MATTRIPWATHTVNWLAGCSHISPACEHCYAEAMTARLSAMPNAPARYRDGVIKDGRWNRRLVFDADAMSAEFEHLRRARTPRRVFAGSMSDLFHPRAPEVSLKCLVGEIGESDGNLLPGTSLLLLTKRPEAMLDWQRTEFPTGLPPWVWVGVTAEDQQRSDERIPVLLQVQAAVRFVSCEPMIGPVDMENVHVPDISEILGWEDRHREDEFRGVDGVSDVLRGQVWPEGATEHKWIGARRFIDWIICGSESGPRARPIDLAWVRSLRDQCQRAGVPFFYKAGPGPDGRRVECPELDGRTWTEIPGGSHA
jgi:protein gp37